MSIFDTAVNLYGVDLSRRALFIIDSYIDKVYPEITGRPHPEMGRGARMGFALKILDCMGETGATMEHMCFVLNSVLQTAQEKGIDPTIFYASTFKVMGYWLLKHDSFTFGMLRGTRYQSVAEYF